MEDVVGVPRDVFDEVVEFVSVFNSSLKNKLLACLEVPIPPLYMELSTVFVDDRPIAYHVQGHRDRYVFETLEEAEDFVRLCGRTPRSVSRAD